MKNLITRKLLVSLVVIGSLQTVHAQAPTHELGIVSYGLNSFSGIFNKELDENRYLHLGIGYADLLFTTIQDVNIGAGLQVGLGIEKRKPVSSKIRFIHGPQPGLMYNFTKSGELIRMNAGIYFSYRFGLRYDLNEYFFAGIETAPRLSASLNNINNLTSGDRVASLRFSAGTFAITAGFKLRR